MSARTGRVELRSISPDATPDEVAAIVAAIEVSIAQVRAAAATGTEPERPSMWVDAARVSARRTGYSRGDWRLSGRLGRRSRA